LVPMPPGRIVGGSVLLNGRDLLTLPTEEMRMVRGREISMIFQEPMTSLNPVFRVGEQIAEVFRLHQRMNRRDAGQRSVEMLRMVGIPSPEKRAADYPHQMSGGMRQRAMIAIALAGEPDLLIADEPTTALDVTIQAQILDLLKRLQRETGMALWLITHDLGIVSSLADRVAVMRQGEIVEAAESGPFFCQPQHPYSLQLFDARPRLESCLNRSRPDHSPPLLEVRDFKVFYPIKKGVFQRTVDHMRAVNGVSFSLPQGQTLALVGESGCGKTTLGKALLNLIESSGGQVMFDGKDVTGSHGEARRQRCAQMQIIFQDPYSAMNPRMLVGDIIEEGMTALLPQWSQEQRRSRVEELLEAVGLPKQARLRYPHEFSGGQRQRICIARALAVNPRLIVCDEPTSALDVSVQKQIIGLLKALRIHQQLSYLFISHDLAVVAELADQVAVMREGKIVEMGPVEQVLFSPAHEYTQKLLQAVPGRSGAASV
ncbi:MAG: dipeptide ABC transporter ATP-binding protein, partial [Methylococcaceae bacterium]|nr:dipeptide ABC transporter ATP-binding protein [Methylococcaceae bacterium]